MRNPRDHGNHRPPFVYRICTVYAQHTEYNIDTIVCEIECTRIHRPYIDFPGSPASALLSLRASAFLPREVDVAPDVEAEPLPRPIEMDRAF